MFKNQADACRSTLVLVSRFAVSDSLVHVVYPGFAYQLNAALVLVTFYQLWYIALDLVAGVSPVPIHSPVVGLHGPHSAFSAQWKVRVKWLIDI